MLHAAGIPADAFHLLPGDGRVGAALVADPRVQGVMFTGSTAVAKAIQRALAGRLNRFGEPVPFVAETGGQNALVVDSSALAEQVVADVIASAFDSAGQRCSALRILCLQEEIADRTLHMLKGPCGSCKSATRGASPSMSDRSSPPTPPPASSIMWRACARGGFPWSSCPCRPRPAPGPSYRRR